MKGWAENVGRCSMELSFFWKTLKKRPMKNIHRILAHLEADRLQKALEYLLQEVSDPVAGYTELQESVVEMTAQYKTNERKKQAGNLTRGEAELIHRQLWWKASEFIRMMREEEGNFAPDRFPDFARLPILLISSDPDWEFQLLENLTDQGKADWFRLHRTEFTSLKALVGPVLEIRPLFLHLDQSTLQALEPGAKLDEAFCVFHEVVGCAVLDGCDSPALGQALRVHLPNVIQIPSGVEQLQSFAACFYAALTEGLELPHAFESAGHTLLPQNGQKDQLILI